MKTRICEKGKIILFFLFLIQIVYIIWSGKENFHIDEFYTYGLSNNMGGMSLQLEEGKSYSGMGPYEEYLTVDKNGEGKFEYANVWKNQAMDVHPPLYYVFIHTICSFFPGVFTKWFGIAFNVACLCIINLLAFYLGQKLLQNDSLGILFAVVNGTMFITMNMVLFIRMYTLMTVFIMALILLLFKFIDKGKLNWKFWIQLYLYSVLGTLTQYYFLIFLFWACLFWGIRLIVKHQWKDLIKYLICLVASGLTCVGIFPAMLEQIFGSGYRGQEAFENAREIGDFAGKLKDYAGIINSELFGTVFVSVIFICALFFLLNINRKKIYIRKILNEKVILLLLCAVGYICIVAQIAPYITDRYIMPVSWIIVLLIMYFLYMVFSICVHNGSKFRIICGILGVFGIMTISSYYIHNWRSSYSFAETKVQLDIAEQYGNNSVIYVYDASWKTMSNMLELMKYKDYQFTKVENLDNLLKQRQEETLVVYIINILDNEKIMQQIISSNDNFEKYEQIYSWGYANVYYLS